MGSCTQAGPGGTGTGSGWMHDGRAMTSPVSEEDTRISRCPIGVCWQEGEGWLGKGEDLGHGAPRSISGPGANLGTCPSLGSVPTQGLGEQDGAGSPQQGRLWRAVCQEAMQEPRIPRSPCARTPIATWLHPSPPATLPACPRITSEQAVRQCQRSKTSGEGGALDVKLLSQLATRVFCLALALFAHPGSLLSARG